MRRKSVSVMAFLLVFGLFSAALVCVLVVKDKSLSDKPGHAELEAHLRFLAADELMGRNAGTYGADIAARYIAEQFRRAGLRTFPTTDHYFQDVPLISEMPAPLPVNGGERNLVYSKNVIGYVEGSSPLLKDEFILLCAHYDHLGTKECQGETSQDIVFNGARDNAMGTVALLCTAKTLAISPPRRSVIFIAFTGEEAGMTGSRFFIKNPPLPLEKVIFVLNNDGGGFNSTVSIRVAGLGLTTAEDLIIKTARRQQMSCMPYPEEYQYLYEKSDNMPFARMGIPALTISPGFDQIDENILKYIHTVEDEADDSFNYSYLYEFSLVYAHIARAVANTHSPLHWRPVR